MNQQSRRASVGLLPQPPALPDKQDYEIMEWKGKYDEICREIEKAEDEVKVMAAQVSTISRSLTFMVQPADGIAFHLT